MIRTRIAELFLSVKFNSTQRLLGRWSPGKGYGEEITVGEGLTLENGVLTASGADSGLPAHLADTANPHEVTAEQVGLGSVDNTADADKPVSTAQATAIAAEAATRAAADTALAESVATESTARATAIAAQATALAAETAARIAADALLVPLPLTRTAAQGSPNIPDTVIITGITAPGGSDPLELTRAANVSGRPSWSNEAGWILAYDDLAWGLNDGLPAFYTTYGLLADSPIGLTLPEPDTGSGLATVNGDALAATAIGQRCQVGGPVSPNRVIYEATEIDPTVWQIASGNIVENEDAPGTYKRLAFVGGTISVEDYPLS